MTSISEGKEKNKRVSNSGSSWSCVQFSGSLPPCLRVNKMFECAIKPLLNLYGCQLAALLLPPYTLCAKVAQRCWCKKSSVWQDGRESLLTKSPLYVLSLHRWDKHSSSVPLRGAWIITHRGFLLFIDTPVQDAHLCSLQFWRLCRWSLFPAPVHPLMRSDLLANLEGNCNSFETWWDKSVLDLQCALFIIFPVLQAAQTDRKERK